MISEQTKVNDTVADVDSDSMWAEFDALEAALV